MQETKKAQTTNIECPHCGSTQYWSASGTHAPKDTEGFVNLGVAFQCKRCRNYFGYGDVKHY